MGLVRGLEAVMKPRIAVLVAVLAVLLASVTAAVAVSVTNGDGDRFGHHDAMMSPHWDSRTDRPRDREEPPHVRGPGGMMSGTGPMHGEQAGTEYAYLAKMVAHHQEAVAAARQLARSDSAEMRDFGESVVASQTAQIEKMQGWLANWYPDRSGQVVYQPMMRDLSGLEGDRLDQLFLQDMVRHHMGAVMMSQQLLIRGVADHQRVEVLARNIRDEQRAEIVQMQRWLRTRFGFGWEHGMGGEIHVGMHGGMHGRR
jgi:uncharacterized protein (DUF305 family)